MSLQNLFHTLVCPLISKIALAFIFQDHPCHAHGLEESFVISSLRIPCRIEVSDQSSQFIFLPGVIIVIQRLDKGLVKFFRQFRS